MEGGAQEGQEEEKGLATLSQALAAIVDKPESSDVRFLVGEDAAPLYACKAILAARSRVFASLFEHGRGVSHEGTPPPADAVDESGWTSTSSSSSSSASAPSASAQPAGLWHTVKVTDVTAGELKHLLYWCYTDSLHPDLVCTPADDDDQGYKRSLALVHFYAAADRYMLRLCKEHIKEQLGRQIAPSFVLRLFDAALQAAPGLALDFILPAHIGPHAGALLNAAAATPDLEEQWLELSPYAAEAVIASRALAGIDEIDLFRAVDRWAEHQLSRQCTDDEQETTTTTTTTTATATKEEIAAPLIEGIDFHLISADDLGEVVEPIGLLAAESLTAYFRQAALHSTFFVPDAGAALAAPRSKLVLDGLASHRKLRWCVSLENVDGGGLTIFLDVTSLAAASVPERSKVSLGGVCIYVYYDRRCIDDFLLPASQHVSVPGRFKVATLTLPGRTTRLTIRVRMPKHSLAGA